MHIPDTPGLGRKVRIIDGAAHVREGGAGVWVCVDILAYTSQMSVAGRAKPTQVKLPPLYLDLNKACAVVLSTDTTPAPRAPGMWFSAGVSLDRV